MHLIHNQNYSIARASKATGIPYDNAKAINRTYTREQRVQKINYKQRYQTRRSNHKRFNHKIADSENSERTNSNHSEFLGPDTTKAVDAYQPQTACNSNPKRGSGTDICLENN